MATYKNRYKDEIIFNEISDYEIEMTGFNNEWCRYSFENDYSNAYEKYLEMCKSLEVRDSTYFIDDPSLNQVRPMSQNEFIEALNNNEHFNHYYKLVKSDKSKYYMVDPSGGPYIQIGSDLERFFNDGKIRIVKHIQPKLEKIIFTISNK